MAALLSRAELGNAWSHPEILQCLHNWHPRQVEAFKAVQVEESKVELEQPLLKRPN